MKNPTNTIIALSAVVALLFTGVNASATVVTLTGGDSTDGLSLDSGTVVYAVYTPSNSSSTTSFQGVTFTAASVTSGVSGVGNQYLPYNTLDTATNAGFMGTPSTEDNNLLALMNAGLQYNGGNTQTLTFSGLADSTLYTVDTINSLIGYSPRTNFISFNGGAVSDTPNYMGTGGASHQILATEDTVESTAGTGPNTGTISITFTSASDGPFYNAVVLSAATPEPSTYALFGLGVLGLTFLARRKMQASV